MKILLLISLGILPLGAQQLIDGIAAVVGNEIVLKSEVDQYVQSYIIQNKINTRNNSEIQKQLEKDILARLVEQKIMLTKADEDTIIADARDVDRRVEEQIRYLTEQVGSEDKLEEIQIRLKKILQESKDDKKIVGIRIYRDDEKFWCGYINDFNENLVLIQHFTEFGQTDGFVLEKIENIESIDSDDNYSANNNDWVVVHSNFREIIIR